MPRPTSARASVHKATDTRSISLLPVGGVVASRPAPSDNRRNALLTVLFYHPAIHSIGGAGDKRKLTLRNPVDVVCARR